MEEIVSWEYMIHQLERHGFRMEIERKFRVKKLPDHLEQYDSAEIEQGYLCKGPIVRIRKWNSEYYLTYKSQKQNGTEDKAIRNEEVELPLNEAAFYHLREKIDGCLVRKTRYLIPLDGGLRVELDIFKGHLEGLYFAEVEFQDDESAKNFKIPDWFGEDVSFDHRFSNHTLSQATGLEELKLL